MERREEQNTVDAEALELGMVPQEMPSLLMQSLLQKILTVVALVSVSLHAPDAQAAPDRNGYEYFEKQGIISYMWGRVELRYAKDKSHMELWLDPKEIFKDVIPEQELRNESKKLIATLREYCALMQKPHGEVDEQVLRLFLPHLDFVAKHHRVPTFTVQEYLSHYNKTTGVINIDGKPFTLDYVLQMLHWFWERHDYSLDDFPQSANDVHGGQFNTPSFSMRHPKEAKPLDPEYRQALQKTLKMFPVLSPLIVLPPKLRVIEVTPLFNFNLGGYFLPGSPLDLNVVYEDPLFQQLTILHEAVHAGVHWSGLEKKAKAGPYFWRWNEYAAELLAWLAYTEIYKNDYKTMQKTMKYLYGRCRGQSDEVHELGITRIITVLKESSTANRYVDDCAPLLDLPPEDLRHALQEAVERDFIPWTYKIGILK